MVWKSLQDLGACKHGLGLPGVGSWRPASGKADFPLLLISNERQSMT